MERYDAKDCTITVNGVYITGLSEDMVTGAKDEEMFSAAVGAQGDVICNEINNPLGTVTLTLQATSPQLPYLKQLAKSKETYPVWVINKSLNERFGGTQARIKNFPELAHGAEAEDREIEIQVFDYTVE